MGAGLLLLMRMTEWLKIMPFMRYFLIASVIMACFWGWVRALQKGM